MEFIYIVMVPDMMDTGKMIYRMVKELKFGKYKFYINRADESKYEGNYVKGKKHGKGIYTWANR